MVDSGVEMMEELGDTVEKLHSMYDLERFITEQERLLKRVPELEEEVRRLKPREDQVAVCFSSSCLLSPCLSLPLSLSLYIFIIFPPISSQLNPLFRQSASGVRSTSRWRRVSPSLCWRSRGEHRVEGLEFRVRV